LEYNNLVGTLPTEVRNSENLQSVYVGRETCSITGDVASLLTETIYMEETLGALRAAKEAGREDPAFRQFCSRMAVMPLMLGGL
jgi:hypothetical protein